jgi:sulfhydrogenase subunit delta
MNGCEVPKPTPVSLPSGARPTVGFFDFTSCEGCQLTVLETLHEHPELLQVVEIVEFREAHTGGAERYDIAFIEGSCTRTGDEDRLASIRERAGLVVALGACAHLAGINALKNHQSAVEVGAAVYGESAALFDSYKARPLSAVIRVDYAIPGCPINPEEFIACVVRLLQGRAPELVDYAVCIECKLREAPCVHQHGQVCLGSVTRAGCGAPCPALGHRCLGCRGLVTNPNLAALEASLPRWGLQPEQLTATLELFLSWELAARRKEQRSG